MPMRKLILVLSTVVLTFPLTGCWDRKEINELALVMAKGIDLTDNNQVKVSVQIALPSQIGGGQSGSGKGESGKSFLVVSGTGRTVSEADANIQQKLPRQLYLPHLRIILVGDRMARAGLQDILDHFGRNPPNRLRTTILVAKGSQALSLMNTTYPLESISGEAIRKLERQEAGVNTTLMSFLIQASSEGMDQYTSAITLHSKGDKEESTSSQSGADSYFSFENQAVFRDLKLVGYLNKPDSIALYWMNQRLRYATLTMPVPNTKGTISVEVTQPKRRAQTVVKGTKVSVLYTLSGSAMVTENSTGLDVDDPHTIRLFQDAMNRYIEKTSKACLQTLFNQFDSDPTGVGRMIWHQHPYDWERLKAQWRDRLPNLQYSVASQVKIVEGGKSGPPLYGKPHRGIKSGGVTTEQVGGGSQ